MAKSRKSSTPAASKKPAAKRATKATKEAKAPKSSTPAASPPVDTPTPTPKAPAETPRPAATKVATERPLFLDATVHLPDKDKDGNHQAKVVLGGRFVDEIDEVELTSEQIDELTAQRVIRLATDAELQKAGRPIPEPAE